MGIDEHLSETFVFRQIVGNHIQVDDRQTDGLANLRSSKTYAFRLCQCFPHVGYQFFQLRIAGRNVISHLSQHRLTIYINR